mgnify:FL=1
MTILQIVDAQIVVKSTNQIAILECQTYLPTHILSCKKECSLQGHSSLRFSILFSFSRHEQHI